MKIKSFFIIFATCVISLLLSSCDLNLQATSEKTSSFTLPEGLKDCTIHKMTSDKGTVLFAMRCPLSSTTVYQSSKNGSTVTVNESLSSQIPTNKTTPTNLNNSNEIEINGEMYMKSSTINQIKVNGEFYQKVQ